MYIHTIWFDKIHFVSRTELEGILRVGSGVGGGGWPASTAKKTFGLFFFSPHNSGVAGLRGWWGLLCDFV